MGRKLFGSERSVLPGFWIKIVRTSNQLSGKKPSSYDACMQHISLSKAAPSRCCNTTGGISSGPGPLKGEKSATITSAKVLKEEELKHIKDKLKDKFSSEFNINTIVDETLIGGLKIQVGSQMIDSSIKNQLQTLKEKMKEVA